MSDTSPRLRPGPSAPPRCPHPSPPWLLWFGPSPVAGQGTGGSAGPAGLGRVGCSSSLLLCTSRGLRGEWEMCQSWEEALPPYSELSRMVELQGAVPASRRGRAGGCRSVVCSEQGLAGSFPHDFLAGSRQHRQVQLLSPPAKIVPPWWKVMLSPTLKSCLEIAVLGGFLTVLRVAPVKELLLSEMLQPKAVNRRLLLC